MMNQRAKKREVLKDRLLFLYKELYGLTTRDKEIISKMCNGVIDYAERWDDGIYIMRIDSNPEMWEIYKELYSMR